MWVLVYWAWGVMCKKFRSWSWLVMLFAPTNFKVRSELRDKVQIWKFRQWVRPSCTTLRRREVHLTRENIYIYFFLGTTRENLVTKFSTIRVYLSFALIYMIPFSMNFYSQFSSEEKKTHNLLSLNPHQPLYLLPL